jgi:hypothetical protein
VPLRFIRRRSIVALAGFALLAVLLIRLGPERVFSLVQAVGANLIVIVAIFAAHDGVRALALGRCVPAETRVPFLRLIRIQLLGDALRTLTHTGAFVSEPARAWLLARERVAASRAYAAAISEFIANSCVSSSLAAVVLIIVLWSGTLAPPLVALAWGVVAISLAYVVTTVAAIARGSYVIGAIARGAGRLPLVGRRLKTDPAAVRRMEDAILEVFRRRPAVLAQVLALELVGQALLVFENYVALRSMGQPTTAVSALLVETLTKLANGVQVVGAAEGVYALVFGWLGMAAAVGFTLSLIKRVRALTLAAIAIAVFGRAEWRSVSREAGEPT